MTHPSSPRFWNTLYRSDQSHWDLAGPTPMFTRYLRQQRWVPGQLLVLGAGRGHDARLFARHGFDVTAVDFSREAVYDMRRMNDPSHPVNVVEADFFTLPQSWNGQFHYLLDYTSFCALPPARRPAYADLVARLLRPKGQFIIVAFPIGTRPGGPPFVVQPEQIIELFTKRSFDLHHRELPPDSVPQRKGIEELLLFSKMS